MKFAKEFLERIADMSNIVGRTRWSVCYEQVFEHEGKHYLMTYQQGATEYQDEQPFEYEPDEIECPEVHQVEKLVKVWEKLP